MNHTTIHGAEIPVSALKFDFFGSLLKFFAEGIRDMNRYMDVASLVHRAGSQNPGAGREQSREGSL
jgi:hypothetical protein